MSKIIVATVGAVERKKLIIKLDEDMTFGSNFSIEDNEANEIAALIPSFDQAVKMACISLDLITINKQFS